jgi:hypothetical protein
LAAAGHRRTRQRRKVVISEANPVQIIRPASNGIKITYPFCVSY